MADIKALIGQVATGAALSREAAFEAFESMMSGDVTPSQIGGIGFNEIAEESFARREE